MAKNDPDVYVVINEGYPDGSGYLTRWLVAIYSTFEEAAKYVRERSWTSMEKCTSIDIVNTQSNFDRIQELYNVEIQYRDLEGGQYDSYMVKRVPRWVIFRDFPYAKYKWPYDGYILEERQVIQRGSILWREE